MQPKRHVKMRIVSSWKEKITRNKETVEVIWLGDIITKLIITLLVELGG